MTEIIKPAYSNKEIDKFFELGGMMGLDCPICGTEHNDACGCGSFLHIESYLNHHSKEEIKMLIAFQPQWREPIEKMDLLNESSL